MKIADVMTAKAAGLTGGEVMTTPALTARPDDDLRVGAARMVTMSIKRLPVVDESGRLVGIVSRRDMLRLFHRDDAEIARSVDQKLRDVLLLDDFDRLRADVNEGIVTLAGAARTTIAARLIEALVRSLPGVLELRSRLVADEADAVAASKAQLAALAVDPAVTPISV
jgi:CBS-domain-containing membrane protein